VQHRIWVLVTSQSFEYGIFVLIMVNTVTLAMKVSSHVLSCEFVVKTPERARCFRQ
jgi:hypothetical protein